MEEVSYCIQSTKKYCKVSCNTKKQSEVPQKYVVEVSDRWLHTYDCKLCDQLWNRLKCIKTSVATADSRSAASIDQGKNMNEGREDMGTSRAQNKPVIVVV